MPNVLKWFEFWGWEDPATDFVVLGQYLPTSALCIVWNLTKMKRNPGSAYLKELIFDRSSLYNYTVAFLASESSPQPRVVLFQYWSCWRASQCCSKSQQEFLSFPQWISEKRQDILFRGQGIVQIQQKTKALDGCTTPGSTSQGMRSLCEAKPHFCFSSSIEEGKKNVYVSNICYSNKEDLEIHPRWNKDNLGYATNWNSTRIDIILVATWKPSCHRGNSNTASIMISCSLFRSWKALSNSWHNDHENHKWRAWIVQELTKIIGRLTLTACPLFFSLISQKS